MFCQYCGASMLSDARFCPECGAPVAGASAGSANDAATASNNQQRGAQRDVAPDSAYGQHQPERRQFNGSGQQPPAVQQPFGQSSYGQQPPVSHQSYGQAGQASNNQLPYGRQPNGAAVEGGGQKRSVSPILVIVIVVVVVALALVLAAALGVFSPNKGGGSTAVPSAAQPVAQSASQGSPSDGSAAAPAGATPSSASSGAGASTSAASPSSASSAGTAGSAAASTSNAASSSAAASASAADARRQAIDKAFAEGYQVFEGTLRVLSADDLAAMQGVDPRVVSGAEGTYAVLVFDAGIQVSGMGADGSGMRRQGATMLGVAQETKYGSSGDLGSWQGHDGQHIAVAAMAEDIWFPSDVSMPVGEPRTANALQLG